MKKKDDNDTSSFKFLSKIKTAKGICVSSSAQSVLIEIKT